MRWVALLLILANAGFAGWLYMGGPGRPKPKPEVPPDIGQLALLRETGESRIASAGEEDNAAECFTVGPFDGADAAARARQRLAELGLEPEQRVLTEEEVYGYQVLLPPYPDRAAALAATRRLVKKGIEEYFVVTEPELENAISLGLFQRKRFAVRHTAYLEELGFDPEMRVRTEEVTRYWQDYRDPQGRITPEVLESLATDTPLQRLERPCS
ncbi:MAG: SPOR domain-containing protein [Halofilum sp. (in: g-proteobacteria)]|nr:SPOR domain-containing protein [Halofilum sp. (in: g-proteobacteria)]